MKRKAKSKTVVRKVKSRPSPAQVAARIAGAKRFRAMHASKSPRVSKPKRVSAPRTARVRKFKKSRSVVSSVSSPSYSKQSSVEYLL